MSVYTILISVFVDISYAGPYLAPLLGHNCSRYELVYFWADPLPKCAWHSLQKINSFQTSTVVRHIFERCRTRTIQLKAAYVHTCKCIHTYMHVYINKYILKRKAVLEIVWVSVRERDRVREGVGRALC